MWEFIGLTLAGLAVLVVLRRGYVAWRTKRREEDAEREVAPEDPDQQARGGGGPTKPVLPK